MRKAHLVCVLLLTVCVQLGPAHASTDAAAHRVTFCVVSDWQISDEHLTHLAERLVMEDPDFVLIPGDLVMANGADPTPWKQFFDRIRPLLDAGTRLLPVPGNHDFDGGVSGARAQWIQQWDLPGAELFYSYGVGPVHVIGLCVSAGMLDEEFDLPDGRMTQLEWYIRDLERSRDATWRFVYHHEPGAALCRFTGPAPGGDGTIMWGLPEVSEFVEPIAWREGVDLIFRGHQHLYERTYPLNPVRHVRDDVRGVALMTVGGGCIGYVPADPADAVPLWFEAVVGIHQMHYLRIDIEGDVLRAEAKNLEGDVFDRFSIRKRPDGGRVWEGLPPSPVFLVKNEPRSY